MDTQKNNTFALFLWSAAWLLATLFIGSRIFWGTWNPFSPAATYIAQTTEGRAFLAVVATSFATASFLVWKYLRYPRVGRFSCLFLCSVSVWITAVFCLAVFRIYYSRPFLLLAGAVQILSSFASYRLFLDPSRLRFALIPGGMADVVSRIPLCRWTLLDRPRLPDFPVDGLVVDLHRDDISPEWIRFIAECTMKRVPLFHAAALYENLTGRVSLEHMKKDLLREMAAPRVYSYLKYPFDLAAVLVSLPLWLPLLGIVAAAVRIRSGSPVFFHQKRTGRYGAPFSILKFRSLETGEDGTQRPTPIGEFLRKHRLDELPQLLNVLKGEMSLIGPRPEQTVLVSQYAETIPFYSFRADLRPGISGWAQVCWKYAEGTDENRIKLEYDIFYLKNFSFWLDLLILGKTVGAVLFGEGSKGKNTDKNKNAKGKRH